MTPRPPSQRPTSRSRVYRIGRAGTALSVGLWIGALLVMRHELRGIDFHALKVAARAVPWSAVTAALVATGAGYALMPLYDLLALRFAGRPLPVQRTWLASFIAFAMSHSMGFAALTGASIRYRFWSGWGLTGSQIARAVLFTTVTFWLGAITLGGGALLFVPGAPRLQASGVVLLAVAGGYAAWVASGRGVTIRGWAVTPPSPRAAATQLTISSVDWILAAFALYVLLPAEVRPPAAPFMAAFLAAQVLGVVSHVPGGLGVFESAMTLMLRQQLRPDVLLPALLVYRVIYYLLPLCTALLAFVAYEAVQRQQRVRSALRTAGSWLAWGAPHFLSAGAFAAGAILLVSGATPARQWRLTLIHHIVPLPFIELSHFAGSIVGLALLLLASGLRRRLDAAWHLTVVLLVVGIMASLVKGLDWEEALFLALVLAALLPARSQFHRKAALTAEPMTAGWAGAILVVLSGSIWLGFFAFRHVGYSTELWWEFALHGDAPRFLRATVGVAVLGLAVATRHLLAPSRPRVLPATATEIERLREAAREAPSTIANLALLGDKSVLFGDDDSSFLMYAVRGRTWIALGDPQGSERARADLAWKFRAIADEHGGRPVFYEVSAALLPLYIELGMTLFKLGEEARVPLRAFSMEGPGRKWMRRTLKDGARVGLEFDLLSREDVAPLLPRLREVSDAWLASKSTREKGFSLGRFDEHYLAQFPVAVVREQGTVVAFANVWQSGNKAELSLDLMRHVPGLRRGLIDFLLVHLILRGAESGYEWFNLGMAPLSGMESHPLAPMWNRIGAMLFRLGEHFYNFQGLRRYKEKFIPVWEPRYLAAPGVLSLPRILLDVASLVSGGATGLVRK